MIQAVSSAVFVTVASMQLGCICLNGNGRFGDASGYVDQLSPSLTLFIIHCGGKATT